MEAKLEGFFRSTLHQLLKSRTCSYNHAFEAWKRKSDTLKPGWVWSVSELQKMFIDYVLRLHVKITMFVDSLDECESPTAARDLIDILRDLVSRCHSNESQLRICISSRHYPNVCVNGSLQITVEESNQVDIIRYTNTVLRGLPIAPDSGLSTEIACRANGMFLWASLMLKRIRDAVYDGESRKELRAIIKRTPQDLEDFFGTIIDTIPTDEREQSSLMFSWVLLARRPLRLAEFIQAPGFRKRYRKYRDYTTSDVIRPEQMKRLLAKYTRGLIEAVHVQKRAKSLDASDLADLRVQFIHESVRQYVSSHPSMLGYGMEKKWSNPGFADDVLARTCFNYIKAVCIESRVTNLAKQPDGQELAESSDDYREIFEDRAFLEYAIGFGFQHAKAADLAGRPPMHLFHDNLDAHDCNSWWFSFAFISRELFQGGLGFERFRLGSIRTAHLKAFTATPIAFAYAHRLDSWIQHLVGDDHPKLGRFELSNALCLVVGLGDTERVAPLIRAGADVDYDHPGLGTPLCIALSIAQDDMVTALLTHNATILKGPRKRNALVVAVLYCPAEISTLR